MSFTVIARKALDMEYLVFKVRPISEGIPLSKTVAKKCGGMFDDQPILFSSLYSFIASCW